MIEQMNESRTLEAAQGQVPPGKAADPYAAAVIENPYEVVGGLSPDDKMRAILYVMQQLQKRSLAPREDAALRTLRDLPSRLSWDLRILGTTPAVAAQEWQQTYALLAEGRRDEALRSWLKKHGSEQSDAALHVRAVLCTNEVAWYNQVQGYAEDAVLKRYVARWAAILGRTDWLAAFAHCRCRVWDRDPPDVADLRLFVEKAESTALDGLHLGAGTDERRAHWSTIWAWERAAIQVVARSGGKKGVPPRWSAGYGPLGLADLGEREQAQEWLISAAAANHWPLPLTALREGNAGFFKLDPEQAAMAASAVQWLFSSLGPAAAEVWNGNGRQAHETLRCLVEGRRREDGPSTTHPWFGEGRGGRRRHDRAISELRSEALLLQVQEELSRPEVPVPAVSETAGLLLFHAASLRRSQVVVDSLETLVIGRLQACIDARRLPHPDEVQRVIDVSLELRTMLLGRNAGERCGTAIAQLIKNRAATAWNRARGGAPRPAIQRRILRELFQAAALAPHRAEVIVNLVRVLLKVQEVAESQAERQYLLGEARQHLEHCKDLGGSSPELEECWNHVRELQDPDAAHAESIKSLEAVLGISLGDGSSPTEGSSDG